MNVRASDADGTAARQRRAPHLTVVVVSFQRCGLLRSLLDALATELTQDDGVAARTDVIVVLDGSTDGSRELVEGLAATYPVPLTVRWQDNQGCGPARNTGLAAATGELVLFLDDDLVPSRGLLRRHLEAHDQPRIVVGPCLVPSWATTTSTGARAWWDERHAELAEKRHLTSYEDFGAANTSGPVALFREVGGFDGSFSGYGLEDYELAVRLLDAGVRIEYDPDAVAYHDLRRTPEEYLRLARPIAANRVRLVERHPHLLDELFPARRPRSAYRLLRRLPRGSERAYALAASVATWLWPVERWVTRGRGERTYRLARAAWTLAGVASVDDEGRFLARLLDATDVG